MDTLTLMFGFVLDLLSVWLPFVIPVGSVWLIIYILRKKVNNAG